MTKYTIVRVDYDSGMKFPVIDEDGISLQFDTEIEADIDRIYLQPDYEERLEVYERTSKYSGIYYN